MYKMNLISAEGYKNAGGNLLKIRKTDELWIRMKDVGDGLNIKKILLSFKRNLWYLWKKKINKRRN